ncbi:MAG: U32 family peptidase [Oscillospiraceae bacterium]|nr:U32 family peptidase [Oscillospiraceae bacterium]
MIELLSPAGSIDALRAAVCNGADAVYLGVEGFNARRGAKNFRVDELPEIVRYCHVRGVKVHLTLNTLVADREMRPVSQVITAAAKAGVDAFIVQDFGVVSLCREIAPTVPIHASTQMSIHSLEGVKQAAALGVSRVVLARELPREEIAFICRSSPVEIEVFVHGALCMCYSGQCYMSGVIGRRSGNRGHCAQPCRLPYGFDRFEEKYPLSLKDNCLIDYLQDLERIGVASLKIEGRMKRPEYVATVTSVYRRALDEGAASDEGKRALRAIFSRQGFTQGYYEQRIGPEMFGVRSTEEGSRQLMQAARASYENVEPSRVPVQFYAIISAGQNIMLAAEDALGNVSKVEGGLPEPARYRDLTQTELTERLSKTGGTPYVCTGVRCRIDPGLSVSAAEINRLRREALVKLTALRARSEKVETGTYAEPQHFSGSKSAPVLTVSVLKTEQITPKLCYMAPAVLYAPLSEIVAHPKVYTELCKDMTVAAILPRVVRDDEMSALLSRLDQLPRVGIRRVLLGNLGQISAAQSRGLEIAGDFGLNLYNSRAMTLPKQLGMVSATASFEMSLPQIRDLSKPLPTEMIVYGRLPLMLTENCLMRNRAGICSCESGNTKLIDRIGEEFRVVRDCGTCRSVILNGKKLYMLDKKSELRGLGLWALRLSFTTENPAEIDGVLADYRGEAHFEAGGFTRGLYQRGVE